MSLRVMTPEEELEGRREKFDEIQTGTIFYLGEVEGERYFLTVAKIDDETLKVLKVVELNRVNRIDIINGRVPRRSVLTFDQMHCLNVPRQCP